MKTPDLMMQKLVIFYWKKTLLLERSIAPTAHSSTSPYGCTAARAESPPATG